MVDVSSTEMKGQSTVAQLVEQPPLAEGCWFESNRSLQKQKPLTSLKPLLIMRIEFVETKYETALTIFPDTADEVAQLFRMTQNTKAEKPYLSLQFNDESGKQVYGMICLHKIKESSNKIITHVSNQ